MVLRVLMVLKVLILKLAAIQKILEPIFGIAGRNRLSEGVKSI